MPYDVCAASARSGKCGFSIPKALLLAVAALNLAVGVALALSDDSRSADLAAIHDWCRQWLFEGSRLYAATSTTDYPPHAIVFLSPIAMLPLESAIQVVAALTLILSPLVGYFIVRTNSPQARVSAAAVPVLLFLCWGGVRTLLQFTRISLTLAFAAALLGDTRSVASGVCLGLALAKPHIAGPIAMWMAFAHRARTILVASAVVAVGFGSYCLRVGAHPLGVIARYFSVVLSVHGASAGLEGRTSVRRWIFAAVDDPDLANGAWIGAALLLLLIPCAMAAIERKNRSDARGAVPAAFCLWSLLSFYHLGNNMILMFPAFVFLWYANDPETVHKRRVLMALIQLELVVDVPVRLRGLAPASGWARLIIVDFDRFLVALAFAYVIVVWWKIRQVSDQPRRHGNTKFRFVSCFRAFVAANRIGTSDAAVSHEH